jgi:hypothetical protein
MDERPMRRRARRGGGLQALPGPQSDNRHVRASPAKAASFHTSIMAPANRRQDVRRWPPPSRSIGRSTIGWFSPGGASERRPGFSGGGGSEGEVFEPRGLTSKAFKGWKPSLSGRLVNA